MASRRLTEVSYGNLGECYYDSESRSWHFSRRSGWHKILRPLGPMALVLPPSLELPPPAVSEPNRSINRQIRSLNRALPEVAPAIPLLPELAYTSQTLAASVLDHESSISRRSAFGKARCVDSGGASGKSIRIYAVAVGDSGESLGLFHVQEKVVGWNGYNDVALRVPEIMGENGAYWSDQSGLLRQICFAEDRDEGTNWLAVRLITSTTIFYPLHHPAQPVVLGDPDVRQSSSIRLNANPLYTLDSDMTGGAPHADVAFNPWYHRQFAVVDQQSHWSVWDIDGNPVRNSSIKVTCVRTGDVPVTNDAGRTDSPSLETDGWASIFWVCDVNIIVVSNRLQMTIFDLKPEGNPPSHSPQLDIPRSSGWILDIRRSPVDDNQLLIVNSTHIIWLEVSRVSGDRLDNSVPFVSTQILLSWRHFRSGGDHSLRLEVTEQDNGFTLLLQSRMNDLITVYQFSRSSSLDLPISQSDPYQLKLPSRLPEVDRTKPHSLRPLQDRRLSDIRILPLRYMIRSNVRPAGLGSLYYEKQVHFFRLFALYNDLSLQECFLERGSSFLDEPNSDAGPQRIAVKPPDSIVKRSSSVSSSRIDTGGGFIVPDGSTDSSDDDSTPREILEERGSHIHGTNHPAILASGSWPKTFESAYVAVYQSSDEEKAEASTMAKLSADASTPDLDRLEYRLLKKARCNHLLVETLYELYKPKTQMEDFENALANVLDHVRYSIGNVPSLKNQWTLVSIATVWPTSLKAILGLHDGDQNEESGLSPLNIHDSMISQWVVPLPRQLSEQFLASTARIASQVCLDIHLASIKIRVKQQDEAESPEASLQLPLRVKGSKGSLGPSSRKEGEERPLAKMNGRPGLPDSNQSQSDARRKADAISGHSSIRSAPSGTPDQASPAQDSPDGLQMLRGYASLDPQPALPSPLTRILDHWAVGADPASYSWDATNKLLARADQTTTDDPAASKSKDRQRRRLERVAQHREKTVTVRESQTSLGPTPSRLWESQPQGDRDVYSSQLAEGPEPMSQGERGPFGARPGAKGQAVKKKKRRVAGF